MKLQGCHVPGETVLWVYAGTAATRSATATSKRFLGKALRGLMDWELTGKCQAQFKRDSIGARMDLATMPRSLDTGLEEDGQ